MIESNLDISKGQGHIVVCPNMSGQWQTTKLFLGIVSCLALLIAIAFALLGLWMILPFAGLEIIALVSLMYWVAHQCRRKQVIHFEDNRIRVENGYHLPKSTWESELFFTRLLIDKPPYRGGQPLKVFLRSKQQQLELGEFLNEQDKKKLIGELRGVINVVN
ncbi:MAG: DUF2244 domain-containing protein [Gammaproteobacteria bacterium]|jgi:uncharacterized membrane protein